MYNSLLLPGTGSNGAQNNTFLDSSTNNFTITRNGNTTQGTFSPYGSNWSNFFPTTNTGSINLTINNPTALSFTSADNITIEAWINLSVHNTYSFICSKGSSGAREWGFGVTSTDLRLYWSTNGNSGGDSVINRSFSFQLNTWYHVAVCKSGSSVLLFVNGTQLGSAGTFTSIYNGSDPFRVATFMDFTGISHCYGGFISNLRFIKGTALYTSNFTPSTTPLTAVTNTQLLTCQSNRFIDNSTNAFAIVANNSPTVQRFSPFSPTAIYSAGTIGGSGYFDGSDYLTAAADAQFDFGTGDFTIEAWVYPISNGQNYPTFLASVTGWSAGASGHRFNNAGYANKFWFGLNGSAGISGGDPFLVSTNTFSNQSWYHYSITRSGNTFRMFVNGALENTQTYSGSYNAGLGGLRSGWSTWDGGQGYFTGYLSNLRMVKGTAVYTSAFTPPTAPVTAISGTSLLLNYTNAGIIDNTMINNLETVGNAQISTTQTKFGSGSMYFDGASYLSLPSSDVRKFGTGNFTFEFWIYTPSNIPSFTKLVTGGSGGSTFTIETQGTTNVLWVTTFDATLLQSTVALTNNTWTHFAAVRNSGTLTIYINGVASGSTSNSTDFGSYLYIGGRPSTQYFTGYMDDIRATKGYARYTSNFTPPTSAFPTY
jgi:hypothetical protein